jgi:hypothetical protein
VRRLPTEPPGGQDGPPDVATAIRAVLGLLNDMHDRLAGGGNADADADLMLRMAAMHSALRRLLASRERSGGL